ncbi:MAG: 30S ribosome-binding factor RbfA, partial [Candidatus Omnitrophica bacterium]|nr:30S ribosome-binding factor RbfA [Candidatus Omnitrophota bacterium]
KVNRELRKQIMAIIQREVDDPVMDFLSITRVETTKDLQESKVYYSLLNENNYLKAKEVLARMRGFIRAKLAREIRLKTLPQLNFVPDESMRYSVDIYKKIDKIKKSGEENEKEIAEEDS